MKSFLKWLFFWTNINLTDLQQQQQLLTERVPQTPIFGYPESDEKRGISSFFAIFLPYLMIFQSSAAPLARTTMKNHQKWQNIWPKMRKSLVQFAFNPFLHGTVSTRISGTRSATKNNNIYFFNGYMSFQWKRCFISSACHLRLWFCGNSLFIGIFSRR